MFGYVTIDKDELKVKEFNLFRAYYCGLCKAIGKQCNQLCRLGLSYDMTFLAILLSSVVDDNILVYEERCMVHLKSRHKIIKENAVIDYCAAMSGILSYLKLCDDVADDHSFKAFFARIPYYFAVQKLGYRMQYQQIREKLSALSKLEKEQCAEVDAVADCFASIMQILFTPEFIQDKRTRKILSWLGYNLGRWIYVLDAYHDLEKDRLKNRYNPFLFQKHLEKDTLENTLTFTLENVAKSYELLEVRRNDAINRNIIYLGLAQRQAAIFKQCEKLQEER